MGWIRSEELVTLRVREYSQSPIWVSNRRYLKKLVESPHGITITIPIISKVKRSTMDSQTINKGRCDILDTFLCIAHGPTIVGPVHDQHKEERERYIEKYNRDTCGLKNRRRRPVFAE